MFVARAQRAPRALRSQRPSVTRPQHRVRRRTDVQHRPQRSRHWQPALRDLRSECNPAERTRTVQRDVPTDVGTKRGQSVARGVGEPMARVQHAGQSGMHPQVQRRRHLRLPRVRRLVRPAGPNDLSIVPSPGHKPHVLCRLAHPQN